MAGMPCWIELSTPEPERAKEFYRNLFGWEYETRSEHGDGSHEIALRDGFPVAGIRESRGDSSWRLYLAVDDVVADGHRAEKLGATAIDEIERPGHIPGIGRKTVLMGPGESEVGLLEPEDSWQFDVGLPGTLMWPELVTIQAHLADHFFREMFNYSSEQFGTEHRSDYAVWYLGDESVLARVSMIREYITPETRPHWLLYFGVSPEVGTDNLMHRAIELGARVRVDPYDSSLGRTAVLRDPTGARFAVVDASEAVGDYTHEGNYDPYDD